MNAYSLIMDSLQSMEPTAAPRFTEMAVRGAGLHLRVSSGTLRYRPSCLQPLGPSCVESGGLSGG